jgi:uncharacterized OB-fold protein
MSEVKSIPGFACAKCNWFDVFETKVCPRCHGPVQETTFTGRGKVASYTVIRYPPKGFEGQSPYIVALVDVENGPRVMARINTSPDNVQIGEEVLFQGSTDGRLEFGL